MHCDSYVLLWLGTNLLYPYFSGKTVRQSHDQVNIHKTGITLRVRPANDPWGNNNEQCGVNISKESFITSQNNEQKENICIFAGYTVCWIRILSRLCEYFGDIEYAIYRHVTSQGSITLIVYHMYIIVQKFGTCSTAALFVLPEARFGLRVLSLPAYVCEKKNACNNSL